MRAAAVLLHLTPVSKFVASTGINDLHDKWYGRHTRNRDPDGSEPAPPALAAARRRLLGIRVDELHRAGVSEELVAGGDERAGEAYLECHSRLLWRKCENGHDGVASGASCNRRICALCARRLAAELVDELERSLDALERQGVFKRAPQQTFKFATFTLRAREDLGAAVREVARAFRKLQQRAGFDRDRRRGLYGAVAAIEIGPHRNVHLHVLYWGRYVSQHRLSELWHQITGDSYVVHVQAVRGKRVDALREVVKYVTKLSGDANPLQSPDADPAPAEARLAEIHFAFKGRRRLLTYGVFYNVTDKAPAVEDVCPSCGAAWRVSICGVFDPEFFNVDLLYRYRYGTDPPLERRPGDHATAAPELALGSAA